MNEELITIHFSDVKPFLKDKNIQQVLLRYLHDRGIEGEMGCDDNGAFVRYYRPEEGFDEFSIRFYEFITKGGK